MATPDMNASEYLQMVLGDVLAKALSEVARERPSDPVQFVAEYLHQVRRERQNPEKEDEEVSFDLRHRQSGDGAPLYEDQEAPLSNDTMSTIDIGDPSRGSESLPPPPRYAHRDSASYHTTSGPSSTRTSSSAGDDSRTQKQLRRSRGRERSRRRRTAQSEPVGGVTSPPSDTHLTLSDPRLYRRTKSLNARSSVYEKNDPRRIISKKVPAAALSMEEYRKKRGLKLPPMKDATRLSTESPLEDEHFGTPSISGKPKPKQLQPIKQDTFDWQKHEKKNKRLLKENRIIANMV